MTYVCPFCKKEMIHAPKNSSPVPVSDNRLVEDGDTFRCECSVKTGYNSWFYTSRDSGLLESNWRFLVIKGKYETEWTKPSKVPHYKGCFIFR